MSNACRNLITAVSLILTSFKGGSQVSCATVYLCDAKCCCECDFVSEKCISKARLNRLQNERNYFGVKSTFTFWKSPRIHVDSHCETAFICFLILSVCPSTQLLSISAQPAYPSKCYVSRCGVCMGVCMCMYLCNTMCLFINLLSNTPEWKGCSDKNCILFRLFMTCLLHTFRPLSFATLALTQTSMVIFTLKVKGSRVMGG